jgi:hypothetical protein
MPRNGAAWPIMVINRLRNRLRDQAGLQNIAIPMSIRVLSMRLPGRKKDEKARRMSMPWQRPRSSRSAHDQKSWLSAMTGGHLSSIAITRFFRLSSRQNERNGNKCRCLRVTAA